MNIKDVFTKINKQYQDKLPFVVYRKPGEDILKCLLQKNDVLHQMDSYDTSGFVFAPFDNKSKSILIPVKNSEHYQCALAKLVAPENIDSFRENRTVNDLSKQEHIKLVNKGIQEIKSGILKKVVLSRKEEVDFTNNNLLDVFSKLLNKYPNAFVYCWYHPKIGLWLGATPETLVETKEGSFHTMALAGTQPYIDTVDVQWGDKEKEEQAMVTDFVLKQLSSVIKNISSSERYTHKAGTLLHLRTDIQGGISNEMIPQFHNIINVLHPTPAVCGLPKDNAKSFILKEEGYDRKYYTGFLGEISFASNEEMQSNLYVNLRCMSISENKASIYVGGGITKDSIPELEWEETVRKTETMKNVLL